MRAAALEELKSRLVLKYGTEAEPSISAKLGTFFQHKSSISIQDLSEFENLLMTQLGFPVKRKVQWSRLQHSSTPESPIASETAPRSRILSQSFDLRAVPKPAEIMPIIRHRKAAVKVGDSPIFPRYENRTTYTPVPDKVKVTDTLRTSYQWKGSEELPVAKQSVDEWGNIIKWDITKYQWEQQNSRRALDDQKREYREYLAQQIQKKEEKTAAEKLELAREQQKITKEAERQRAIEALRAKERRDQHIQHKQELQEDIDKRAKQRLILQQAKATERMHLDYRQEIEKEAETQHLQGRRAHCLSLTDHNLKAAAERQNAHHQTVRTVREVEKKKAEALVQQLAAESLQQRKKEQHAARDVQRHNQQVPRRGNTAESHHTAHAELFRLQEQRQRQIKHQQMLDLAVLSQQALDKTQRDGVWRTQEQEQAELWRQEQARQLQEDLAQAAAMKATKQQVKHTLTQQIQTKQKAESQARRLSPAEAKLNRSLFQAAIGAL